MANGFIRRSISPAAHPVKVTNLKKLVKIQLIKLKHDYGKINDHIEQFRTLSNGLGFSEEALVLVFYNGLHSKFQEEIEEMEAFPIDLDNIYTKYILLENTLKT